MVPRICFLMILVVRGIIDETELSIRGYYTLLLCVEFAVVKLKSGAASSEAFPKRQDWIPGMSAPTKIVG